MRKLLAPGIGALCLWMPSAAGAVGGVDITLHTEYRSQWAAQHAGEDSRDQDLRVWLGLEVPLVGVKGLAFSVQGSYGKDLDGTNEASPFKDNLDSYSNRDDLRLDRAVLTYTAASGRAWLTAGRQDVWGAEAATLDGGLAHFQSACRHVQVEVFGGRRVSHYEYPDPLALYGANLQLRPLSATRLDLRGLRYLENSYEAVLSQTLGSWGSGRAVYRMIGSDPRDVSVDVSGTLWKGAEVRGIYTRKLADAGEGDRDFTYDATSPDGRNGGSLRLPSLAPYADYRLEARQGLFGVLGVGGRLRHHVVVEEADEDSRNASFDEGSLLVDLAGWPWKGLRLEGEATRWVEERSGNDVTEENLWGFSARLEQSFLGHSVGAGIHRQAYDTDGGVRDSSGFEAWARVRLANPASVTLRYERQVDDLYRQEGVDVLQRATCRLDLSF